jgi:hypothetical protein
MPVRRHHWEWFISCALFGAILLALVIALVLQDPIAATVP